MSSENADRVWALMEKIGFCMLSTREGDDIRARPMAAHVARKEHAIYFLSDAESHNEEDIERDPNVGLAFADTEEQDYVSVTGLAMISNDRAKIKELWSTPAKAWWDSFEDPSIRVLKIVPKDARYWSSPGKAASYVKVLSAAATAEGETAKTRL